jgi:hypothetical protein
MSAIGTETLAERVGMEEIINGIAQDLRDLRAGTISIEDARVRAELAKQLLGGVRIVVTARKHLQELAKPINGEAEE